MKRNLNLLKIYSSQTMKRCRDSNLSSKSSRTLSLMEMTATVKSASNLELDQRQHQSGNHSNLLRWSMRRLIWAAMMRKSKNRQRREESSIRVHHRRRKTRLQKGKYQLVVLRRVKWAKPKSNRWLFQCSKRLLLPTISIQRKDQSASSCKQWSTFIRKRRCFLNDISIELLKPKLFRWLLNYSR